MSKLRLYDYNNYFNRIVKKESTLANYGTPIYVLTDTNFDMNDSVSAKHVINYSGFDGDYVIITDDNDNITSRWFVLENVRVRGGQHQLQLRRDLIVDNYDKIINAPAVINRAMINNKENALLYNSEGFSFNQIKKNEYLIRADNIAWYVLYFANNAPKHNGTITTGNIGYDYKIETPIANSIYGQPNYNYAGPIQIDLIAQAGIAAAADVIDGANRFDFQVTSNAPIIVDDGKHYNAPSRGVLLGTTDINYVKTNIYNSLAARYDTLKNYVYTDANFTPTTGFTDSDRIQLINSNGKIVKDSANKYYRVIVTRNNLGTKSGESSFDTGNLGSYVKSQIELNTVGKNKWYYGGPTYQFAAETIFVSYEEISVPSVQWEIDFTTKVNTKAEYNVVFIPYLDCKVTDQTNTTFQNTYDINRRVVNDIIKTYTSEYIYDIQLLPYCPFINAFDNTFEYDTEGNLKKWEINILAGFFNANNYYLHDDESNACFIYYANEIDFTYDIPALDINKGLVLNDNTRMVKIPQRTSNEAENYKVSNECDLFRIVSPNYNGIFEFSGAKNNGVDYFNIDVTLRPYNPYIHINPNFKFLYGIDFDDSRGLICQGDFSLPIVNDQFKEYEIRNKNYLNVFNREISHIDFEYGKARTEALFGAVTGTIGAGIGGAVAGGKLGGIGGAVAGGATGLIGGAVGGAIDYNIMIERQAENKNYKFDMFNYQLGNIKALPYSITKVTPFTHNNKIWPFLEVYSCTDTEANILIDKIKYTSMNVNAIGTIGQYLQNDKTFISASIIRLEDLHAQTREANVIYDELMKGVYI